MEEIKIKTTGKKAEVSSERVAESLNLKSLAGRRRFDKNSLVGEVRLRPIKRWTVLK